MTFKRAGKQIYGVELTAAEKRALDEEATKAMAEYTRKHDLEIEALVLYQLRQLTGWGETRLKRFYAGFSSELEELIKRYELTGNDAPWLCTERLKEEGFDIEQWHKEKYPNERYEVKRKRGE